VDFLLRFWVFLGKGSAKAPRGAPLKKAIPAALIFK
jgi:hypothetical protein